MPPVVVDAAALVELLLRTPRGPDVEAAVDGRQMVAPDLINAETLSVLRRMVHRGELSGERAQRAVARLATSPLRRYPTGRLIELVWALRDNVTSYDACYVTLADQLGCPLVTGDRRLARAPELAVSIVTV